MGKMIFTRENCLNLISQETDQFSLVRATGIIDAPFNLESQLWRLNNLYWIVDKKGKRVKFRMKDQQYLLYKNMWFLNIILKSRQHGFTTFICIFCLDTILFNSNTRCGIIAHKLDDVKEIFDTKIKFPFENLEPELRELYTDKKKGFKITGSELKLSNNSKVSVNTSYRSGTLQILHISEMGKIAAKFPEKAKEIKSGAFEAVEEGQMIFVESTAEGQDGMFKEMCDVAENAHKEGRELHPMEFKFHFVPWWKEPAYSTNPKLVIITKEEKQYFQELADKHGINLTPGQKAWYALKSRSLKDLMKREHPSTPEEAFEAAVDGAYYGQWMTRARKEGRITTVPYDPGYGVNTWWDLGVNDHTTIWFHQQIGLQHRFIDYEEHSGEGWAFYAKLLQNKRYVYDTHYMPHDSAKRDFDIEIKTRIEKAMSVGIKPITKVPRPRNQEEVLNYIDISRDLIDQAWIDKEKCSKGIAALDGFRKEWDAINGRFKDKYLHNEASHGASAFWTGAAGYKEQIKGTVLDRGDDFGEGSRWAA